MKIGVFDSGIGGLAIANTLKNDFKNAKIIYVNDSKNLPYGDKSDNEIISLTDNAIKPLLLAQCSVIVIACNTATAIAIDFLRQKYPEQVFIGIEPMIKTASSLSKSGIITVCATPATLRSDRYQNLKRAFANDLTINEPDCSKWAQMIEQNNVNQKSIERTIKQSNEKSADVIVLGCTHYHWIKDDIVKYTDKKAIVIEPSIAISKQVKRVLELC